MKRVLAISGGGMRGAIPARALVEIERITGQPIHQTFDLVSGTSTGAILAALAASPKAVTAREILDLYYRLGPAIFSGFLPAARAIFAPRYSSHALCEALKAAIGEPWHLSQATTRLLIPSVDADRVEAVFIKSWDEYWHSLPLWAAAAASASAQTFFPAFSLPGWGRFLDGGNHTNNPAASALFEAWRLWPGEKIRVLHLGTGKQADPEALPDGGLACWAPLVFGTTSECQDDCARYFCAHAPGVDFLSIDVMVPRFPGMDDARTKTLDTLVALTTEELIRRSAELTEFLK